MDTKKLLLILMVAVLPACSKHPGESPANTVQESKALYHCAMHPQIVSEHPGECPICHMKLTRVESSPEASAPAPRKLLYYRNPMNPAVTSPVPMKDNMGMAYVPVYSDEGQAGGSVPGQAAIRMSSEMEQRIGVRVAEVVRRELIVPIQAAARVAYDPQLYSATLEHQEAVKYLKKARASGSSESTEQALATVHSSHLRLRQMGLSEAMMEEVESPDYNPSDLLVGSKGGRLWVYADIYDTQASLVHPGQKAELTSPAFPGKSYQGTVRAIDAVVNSDSRTLRVRIKTSDPDGDLRPGVYLSAMIHASVGHVMVVPESAVVDTGARQLVYVQTVPGTYEPRVVKVGHLADGFDEIVDGLHPGEKVATSANFLIDSESRIQAAAKEAAKHL